MKLYYMPLSTYSQKTLLGLHEKELQFERVIVNLEDDVQAGEYRALHPLGTVPLMIANDGRKIPESTSILEYVDHRYGAGSRLLPRDPELAQQTRFGDRMFDLYLNDSVVAILTEQRKPEAQRDAPLVARMRQRIDAIYRYMEELLARRDWINGERFSLADCAAAPALLYAQHVAPFDNRCYISAYWKRIQARPAHRQLMEEVRPWLKRMSA